MTFFNYPTNVLIFIFIVVVYFKLPKKQDVIEIIGTVKYEMFVT